MSDFERIPVAGNGLLDRRLFLRGGLAGGAALLTAKSNAVEREDWMRAPCAQMDEIGEPSPFEAHVKRSSVRSSSGTSGTGVSFTPLELLDGIMGWLIGRCHSALTRSPGIRLFHASIFSSVPVTVGHRSHPNRCKLR
jgi:hypothetical protein